MTEGSTSEVRTGEIWTGEVWTGGCQCGAVRYRVDGALSNASICHCRMCQKASGNLFGAFAATPLVAFTWTRGAPAVFKASEAAERGFCIACGTGLYFKYSDKPRLSVAIGSLDAPRALTIERQYGIEGRIAPLDALHALAGSVTEDDIPAADLPRYASLQHPDHDTAAWPPQNK
jgi:hypothetical protein